MGIFWANKLVLLLAMSCLVTHVLAMRKWLKHTHIVLCVLLRVVSRIENTHLDVTVAVSTEGNEGVCTRGQICYKRHKKRKR